MPSPSQATGADGVGPAQQSEVDDQRDSLDGDVALPAVLNVLEAKEDGKGEREEPRSFAASAFEASDAEQPKAEPADGSGSDVEDALETLGQAPPESESDVGTPGQRSDSDVPTPDSFGRRGEDKQRAATQRADGSKAAGEAGEAGEAGA